MRNRTAPPYTRICCGDPCDLKAPVYEDVCLIAAEGLRNALRHSQARNIRVEAHFKTRDFQLIIEDDGIGIDPEFHNHGREGHFGLAGMRERTARHGGGLKMRSARAEGTELHLSIPARRAYR